MFYRTTEAFLGGGEGRRKEQGRTVSGREKHSGGWRPRTWAEEREENGVEGDADEESGSRGLERGWRGELVEVEFEGGTSPDGRDA